MPSSGSTTQRTPAVAGASSVALLAEDRVVGRSRLEHLADRALGGDVGLADEVGRRALRRHRARRRGGARGRAAPPAAARAARSAISSSSLAHRADPRWRRPALSFSQAPLDGSSEAAGKVLAMFQRLTSLKRLQIALAIALVDLRRPARRARAAHRARQGPSARPTGAGDRDQSLRLQLVDLERELHGDRRLGRHGRRARRPPTTAGRDDSSSDDGARADASASSTTSSQSLPMTTSQS